MEPDARAGGELPKDMVTKGRAEEMNIMEEFEVCEWAPHAD